MRFAVRESIVLKHNFGTYKSDHQADWTMRVDSVPTKAVQQYMHGAIIQAEHAHSKNPVRGFHIPGGHHILNTAVQVSHFVCNNTIHYVHAQRRAETYICCLL